MKVLCKKDYDILMKSGFHKNVFYTVVFEDASSYWIRLDNGVMQNFKKEGYKMFYDELFDDYFYTLEESRKMKLNNINDIFKSK